MSGGKNKQFGYTIVEVLIVVAISGVMFVMAATFVGGKQQRVAFSDGLNGMAAKVQSVIEQVTDGKYSDIGLSCNINSSGSSFTSSAQGQGTNANCVFLGKLLYVQPNSPNFNIFSLAGNMSPPSSVFTEVQALNAIYPSIIEDPNSNGAKLTTSEIIPQNLDLSKITINSSSGTITSVYAFGFTQGVGATNASGYVSGAQTPSLVYAPPINVASQPYTTAASNFNSYTSTPTNPRLNIATSVSLCLTNGTRNGLVNVGDSSTNANRLAVSIQDLGTASCP